MEGEKSVGQVVTETGRGQANVSKHLKLMSDSGLVRRRKEGLQVFIGSMTPGRATLHLVCSNIRGEVERRSSRKGLAGPAGFEDLNCDFAISRVHQSGGPTSEASRSGPGAGSSRSQGT